MDSGLLYWRKHIVVMTFDGDVKVLDFKEKYSRKYVMRKSFSSEFCFRLLLERYRLYFMQFTYSPTSRFLRIFDNLEVLEHDVETDFCIYRRDSFYLYDVVFRGSLERALERFKDGVWIELRKCVSNVILCFSFEIRNHTNYVYYLVPRNILIKRLYEGDYVKVAQRRKENDTKRKLLLSVSVDWREMWKIGVWNNVDDERSWLNVKKLFKYSQDKKVSSHIVDKIISTYKRYYDIYKQKYNLNDETIHMIEALEYHKTFDYMNPEYRYRAKIYYRYR